MAEPLLDLRDVGPVFESVGSGSGAERVESSRRIVDGDMLFASNGLRQAMT